MTRQERLGCTLFAGAFVLAYLILVALGGHGEGGRGSYSDSQEVPKGTLQIRQYEDGTSDVWMEGD